MEKERCKILCFEYIIYSLIKWHKELYPQQEHVELFTRLKSLKLLFLVSAVEASASSEGLLDIFDKFYAMQHGPVESDIYNAMVTSTTCMYDFKERETGIKNGDIQVFSQIPKELKEKIDHSILSLKEKNASIVWYKSFDLVEITHKWESWRVAISIAKIFGKGSELMSTESIKNDLKYFS